MYLTGDDGTIDILGKPALYSNRTVESIDTSKYTKLLGYGIEDFGTVRTKIFAKRFHLPGIATKSQKKDERDGSVSPGHHLPRREF
jgi:hypothetical protein